MPYALAVQSTTGPHTVDQWDLCEASHPHAGSRRIPDTHLSETDHVTAFVVTIRHDIGSVLKGFLHFLHGHGRLVKKVTGSSLAHLAVDKLGDNGEIEIHAAIHDLQLKPMLAGKVANSRSSVQEIMDHLASYLLGRFAYALVGDAVIRCIDYVHGMTQDRR